MKPSNYRWVIIFCLFVLNLINYIDRSSIAYSIDLMGKDFHLDDSQMGLILGAFGVGYLLTTFLGGLCADKFGAKWTLTVGIIFWGLASMLTGLAHGFFIVFIARVLLGLAEGPSFPSLNRAVSDWLPETERNKALSLALISVPISLAIGAPLVTWLIGVFNWQGMFFILAILILAWLPFWLWLFKDDPRQTRRVNQAELEHIQQQCAIPVELKAEENIVAGILKNKTLMANNWAFFVFGYMLFFFMTWLPTYLQQTYGLNLKEVGFFSMMPWLLSVFLMLMVGNYSDYLFKHTGNLRLSRSYPIILSQLLSALCVIPILFLHSLLPVMFFVSLAVGFSMAPNAAYFAVNIDINPQKAGSTLGFMDMVFAISGFISPSLTGALVGWTGHYHIAFLLLAILLLSSVLVMYFFHNRHD